MIRLRNSPALARISIGLGLCCCFSLFGCRVSLSDRGLDADDATSRLFAIRRAAIQRDAQRLPGLVEQLQSDDPVVRMLAIVALERITGTRLGYDALAERAQRERALRRWVDRLQQPPSPSESPSAAD